MADPQEFDRSAAVERIRGFASRVKSIQTGLFAVSNDYSNPSPRSDEGEKKYRNELYRDLEPYFNNFRKLMDDLD